MAPQAFRSWQTCTPVPCLSPGMVIRLKEISAAIEYNRGCPNSNCVTAGPSTVQPSVKSEVLVFGQGLFNLCVQCADAVGRRLRTLAIETA